MRVQYQIIPLGSFFGIARWVFSDDGQMAADTIEKDIFTREAAERRVKELEAEAGT
jgi:hypothetical protein